LTCPHRLQQRHILVHWTGRCAPGDFLGLDLRLGADSVPVGGEHLPIVYQDLACHHNRPDLVPAGGVDQVGNNRQARIGSVSTDNRLSAVKSTRISTPSLPLGKTASLVCHGWRLAAIGDLPT